MSNNIYFTADLHLGIGSYRTLSNRNFSNIQEHENFILKNINETCDNTDTLYIVGDLGYKDDKIGMANFLSNINCKKRIVVGNHDNIKNLVFFKNKYKVEQVAYEYNFRYCNNYFHVTHYPQIEWYKFYNNSYCIYGHTHGNIPQYLRSMDCGIDNIGFKPISINEVVDRLSKYNNIDENGNKIKALI